MGAFLCYCKRMNIFTHTSLLNGTCCQTVFDFAVVVVSVVLTVPLPQTDSGVLSGVSVTFTDTPRILQITH